MVKVGLYVKLEAKPGKEDEVEQFLKDGLPIVQEEPDTVAWFAIRLGPSTFGKFDVFPDESGRASSSFWTSCCCTNAKILRNLLPSPPLLRR